MAENGQNSKSVKHWVAWAALAVSLLSLIQSVWHGGGEWAATQAHLEYNDKRLDSMEQRLTRDEDKMEPQIELMRQSIQASQDAANRETELLNELERRLH